MTDDKIIGTKGQIILVDEHMPLTTAMLQYAGVDFSEAEETIICLHHVEGRNIVIDSLSHLMEEQFSYMMHQKHYDPVPMERCIYDIPPAARGNGGHTTPYGPQDRRKKRR